MANIAERFGAANEKLKRIPVEGSIEHGSSRWRLYGLSKQATEGDCRVPCPPKENVVLRTKWEAWSSFHGKTKEQAMVEFLGEFTRFEIQLGKSSSASSSSSSPRASTSNPTSAPAPAATTVTAAASATTTNLAPTPATPTPSTLPAGPSKRNSLSAAPVTAGAGVIKQGTLFKQQDVFKGWKPRRFVLKDNFLHYYVEDDELVPKKSMDISGCSVVSVKAAKVAEVDYFPFVISHPKSSKVYNLASSSKADADDWIAKLSQAASAADSAGQQQQQAQAAPLVRLLERRPVAQENEEEDGTRPGIAVNAQVSMNGIPAKYVVKIERAVDAILEAVHPNQSAAWEVIFDKNGVVGRRRGAEGICVRGDGTVPFCVPDVLGMLLSSDQMKDFNVQVHFAKLLKTFNSNTGIQMIKYKQVWPAAVRDMVCLYHWRLLSDGRVVVLSFSEKFDDLCPPEEGVVRAELILGGFVLSPTRGKSDSETLVQYVSQSDLKGSLPASMLNLLSSTQPLIVCNLQKALAEKFSSKKSAYSSRFSFQDLLEVAGSAPDAISSAVHSAGYNSANAGSGGGGAVSALSKAASLAVSSVKNLTSSVSAPPSSSLYNSSSRVSRTSGGLTTLTPLALLVILIPPLLYYVVPSQFRGVAFALACIFSGQYIIRLHLGSPVAKPIPRGTGNLASGRTLVRFPVDLGKLLRYLDNKREETGVDITMTHIAAKAAAMAIIDMPIFNGRLQLGKYYKVRGRNVDVSVSVDMGDETLVLKVIDSDLKPVEYIADELTNSVKELKANRKAGQLTRKEQILRNVPPFIVAEVEALFTFLGAQLGLTIPGLGVVEYPLGVCSIITAPNKEGDADIDIAMIPNMHDSSTPITITIGGIRVMPSLDQDRKVTATPVLNVAVAVDSKAGSLSEGRRFCTKLQQYMNNPALLDKADRKIAVAKEDAKSGH